MFFFIYLERCSSEIVLHTEVGLKLQVENLWSRMIAISSGLVEFWGLYLSINISLNFIILPSSFNSKLRNRIKSLCSTALWLRRICIFDFWVIKLVVRILYVYSVKKMNCEKSWQHNRKNNFIRSLTCISSHIK